MNLVRKEINFNNDTILTVLENGKVYVSIKHVCKNLGMTENQIESQRQKITKEETLKKGYLKFQVGVFDPNNITLGIELEFLPIWLAKVNPARFDGELKEKLLDYQLHCQKVLADEFFGKREYSDTKEFENNPFLREIKERTDEVYQIEEEIKDLLIRKINECELIIWRIEYLKRNAESIYKNCLYEKIEIDGREINFKEVNELGKVRLAQIKKSLENI